MVRKLILGAALGSLIQMQSQNFTLLYPFSSVTSSSGSLDPTPSPTATGVSSGSFTAMGLYSNPSTSNVFAFQGWPTGSTPSSNVTFTGSADQGKYFEIVLSPHPDYVVDLTSMYFYVNRSASGARHWTVKTNKNGYTGNISAIALGTNSGTVITTVSGDTFFWSDWAVASNNTSNNLCRVDFTGPNFTNQYLPYHIRIFAWDGASTAGSWRIDSVVINGVTTFSPGVGLSENSPHQNEGCRVYPNPLKDDLINIECARCAFSKFEIFNPRGEKIEFQEEIISDKIRINLQNLPNGIYFVRIAREGSVSYKKLVISR